MKGTWTVKEWIFDKINDAAKRYNTYIAGEYKDGMLDHSKLRVEEVLAETDKAYKVALDAETANGHVKTWTAWVPKSAIVTM